MQGAVLAPWRLCVPQSHAHLFPSQLAQGLCLCCTEAGSGSGSWARLACTSPGMPCRRWCGFSLWRGPLSAAQGPRHNQTSSPSLLHKGLTLCYAPRAPGTHGIPSSWQSLGSLVVPECQPLQRPPCTSRLLPLHHQPQSVKAPVGPRTWPHHCQWQTHSPPWHC